ncbi:cob(I)yrinic acid a,c-diamide adenosyltransferase [Parasporobacterium paucivorans]|uniref:Cob(I)alamin adenosyltransferase n=1 Tax=Parasporobacterium paucivorans DSM 15970 TaxID=1122934 RepID=A0A1M6CCA0_9FIRM|nr:cob(I)yrinic acid a,c-diamide adenosyltransferase [Parasporobacterium paucivorans]SHI58414.1 cob(I)alamin adenosyltransferase [Parasporobacterium paucivorans DSM 15970]
MSEGYTQVFCGDGDGKSSAALGKGLISAGNGKKVIVIRFLKSKLNNEILFFSRLEPEIKLFRFEKSNEGFEKLSPEDKAEEIMNIKNGINFARKVLITGECDILILDEVLKLIEEGILKAEELINVLKERSPQTTVFMTGHILPVELEEYVDCVSEVTMRK